MSCEVRDMVKVKVRLHRIRTVHKVRVAMRLV